MVSIFVKNKTRVQVAHICSLSYSGGSWFQASPGKKFTRHYLKKPFTKIRLVEWLQVKALISTPSTEK
jgi:hypothetical protein